MIEVGDMLYGFCGGYFGRDSYGDKVVIAAGGDWLVARDLDCGEPLLAVGDDIRDDLEPYKTKPAI